MVDGGVADRRASGSRKGSRVVPVAAALAALLTAPAVAVPPRPEPAVVPGGPAPPPAWVETEAGDHWLQTSFEKWCEGDRCVIVTPPAALAADAACRDILADVPEVRVRPGERVVFHLGFQPSALRLTVAHGLWIPPREGPGRTVPLAAADEPAWTATGPSGGIATLVPETSSGTVWYRARLAITTDRVAPRLTGLRAERRGRGLEIRFRLSERATVAGCLERIGPRGVASPRSGRSAA